MLYHIMSIAASFRKGLNCSEEYDLILLSLDCHVDLFID